jgi:hypothetical protein
MIEVPDYPLPLIFVASLVALFAASEIGRWVGARNAERGESHVSTLESSILGLLALMISFTFAMALSRYDARRDAVLTEANAIGTTALRARMLPAPHNSEILRLLREYVQLRLDVTLDSSPRSALTAAIVRSSAIQELLWQQARAVAIKDNAMVPTGLFVQSLNDMIDEQEKRLTALRNSVPTIVVLALYGIAIVTSGIAGYAEGRELRPSRLPVYLLYATVAAVILLIQDLDRPGGGFITINQQPMIDTATSLANYRD